MKKKLLYNWLLVGVFGLSCTEKIEPTPFDYTKNFSGENSKTWVLKRVTFLNDEGDNFEWALECELDDEYIFYRDDVRKFEYKTGSKKCYSSDVSFTETWSFSNASSTLYFSIPFLTEIPLPYTVVDVDKNDLEVRLYLNNAGTQSYRMKFESDDY